MENEEIVRLFLERNEEAISRTAEKYGPRLQAFARQITGDYETAKECENDTYLEAWNRIPPDRPEAYFEAYLFRIVRCISIDRCRKSRSSKRNACISELTEELELCIPSGKDVAEEYELQQLGAAITRFLLSLSEEKRAMFLRRYYYLEPVSDIAKSFSTGESRTKMILFRTRQKLRGYLQKEGYTV